MATKKIVKKPAAKKAPATVGATLRKAWKAIEKKSVQTRARTYKIELVKDRTSSNKQCWRWHLVAPNGRLVCTSGEPFFHKGNAKRAAVAFWDMLNVPCEFDEEEGAK